MEEDWLTALLTRAPKKGERVPVPRPRPFSNLPDIPPEMMQLPPEKPSPPTEYGSPRHEALRTYGLDKLKQAMWDSLGVDYVAANSPAMKPGYFNDSRTPWDIQRGIEDRGQPNADALRNLEMLMEWDMRSRGEAAPNSPELYDFYSLGDAFTPQRKGKI